MSAKIFDGKAAADNLLVSIHERVKTLGIVPKVISFYKEDDPASKLYTRIKKQKAESVGIEFEDIKIYRAEDTVPEIKKFGEDKGVSGILVQHPTGEFAFTPDRWDMLVRAIPPGKDIDGLRHDSPFVPATVRAIIVALSFAKVNLKEARVAVIGATGMVGRPLVRELRERGGKIREIDETTQDVWYQTKNADVVISCVGQRNLIRGDQLREGAVVIDCGSPGGDVDFESARAVASFLTPVPGGIGPLTVVCLLENIVLAAERLANRQNPEVST
ncbi:MAG: hypothetical protein A2782_00375 [Candidatus Blackburnbacteria bacterium RIFCSPHIGHO2_01_FULL_43_15b]|uniref:Bifunctional protein FolD n=1 Tax=Candidatus Blackburnbacteria bacterium RIFCSPHIGHO2_01_FULL_43_15b TaxID=1797513 RepID=A0A1G1UYP3_9BACT|nr:MAG: hypothetical protein A2782_00375 [Candidatus Blackburnbacteria bacterium RIFCSPHIGHO2_01_FULL_43_15b]